MLKRMSVERQKSSHGCHHSLGMSILTFYAIAPITVRAPTKKNYF